MLYYDQKHGFEFRLILLTLVIVSTFIYIALAVLLIEQIVAAFCGGNGGWVEELETESSLEDAAPFRLKNSLRALLMLDSIIYCYYLQYFSGAWVLTAVFALPWIASAT